MSCKEYDQLNIVEANIMLGKISHLIRTDSQSFSAIASIIRNAESNGLLDGITFMPKPLHDLEDENFKDVIN